VEKQRLGLRAKSGLDSFCAFGCEDGLFAVFDLINDFPNEWRNANDPPAGATERVLTINKLNNEKLAIFTKGREPKISWRKKFICSSQFYFGAFD